MKKTKPVERNAGIWLDQENAIIVHLQEASAPVVEKLASGVETRLREPGQSKKFSQYGQTIVGNQEKKQHRQHNQREHFFKDIISHIRQEDHLYLFGPAAAKEGLMNAMEKVPGMADKVSAMATTGKLTSRAAIVVTNEYFNGEAYRLYRKNRKKALKMQS
jgi:stalled ribosome rescue protein Dom34